MTHSFDKDYWDQIWDGDRAPSMAAGHPNPQLILQVSDLAPGTALDAGCGAGAEAIWLAAQGWQVTAADIAPVALAHAAERAATAGVAERVEWVEADLSTWRPDGRYDLVTTHYAHPAIPQLDFYDRIASWVAPAGTLLIVGHLHHHDQDAATGHGHGHGHGETGPPASAEVTAADITARLDPVVWEIVTAQEPHRALTGHGGHTISMHDVVVTARRRH
ncbi:class I SAM-dependent methyltransferase [Micromonospora sp. DT53]|uniref:class I SAM-dependent methyltransferase n=1 Tax=Micromonospora sp. DT53 TaxID=3393444 RepID=UPI003CF8F906